MMRLSSTTSFSSQRHMRAPYEHHPRSMDTTRHGLVDMRQDPTASKGLGRLACLIQDSLQSKVTMLSLDEHAGFLWV
jgi:hypothetical protein